MAQTRPYLEHQEIFRPQRNTRRTYRRSQPYPRITASTASWRQKFFCLSSCTATTIPTTKAQKRALTSSGLGEKVISIDFTASSDDLHQKLLSVYPPLRVSGGYQLCKCVQNTRSLQVIEPPPSGHTPVTLAGVIGQSRIYVRPLQSDISLGGSSSQVC